MKAPAPLSPDFTVFVTVGGCRYPLRGDVKSVTDFMTYIDKSEEEDDVFLTRALEILYPVLPPDRDGAFREAIAFYNGGTFPQEGYYSPLFLPAEQERVFEEIRGRYGIDLNETPMAWWDFRRLRKGVKHRG